MTSLHDPMCSEPRPSMKNSARTKRFPFHHSSFSEQFILTAQNRKQTHRPIVCYLIPSEILTQVTLPCQFRVEAHLTHPVCPSHEEVDDGISHHTVGKSLDVVVVAVPDVQTVALLSPFFHRDGVSKRCRVTCRLPDRTANLPASAREH